MTSQILEPRRLVPSDAEPRRPWMAGCSASDLPPRLPGPSAVDRGHPGPLRVLIVDDNADAADCFALLLQLSGHVSRIAHTGEQAMALAEAFLPDIAFLDIGLPDMDGHQLARALRRRLGPSVTLVALTGWGGEETRREALANGFDLHLTKPADPQAIDRILAQRARMPGR